MISIQRTNFRYSRKKSAISNSQLWNAMMHPFTKMTVKGAIWYQGLYHSCWYTSIRGNDDIYEEMYTLSFWNSDFWRFNFWGFFLLISLRTSGEANAHKPDTYKCTFPTMIDDWRKKFSAASGTTPNFPFGFVQVLYIFLNYLWMCFSLWIFL